MRHSFNLHALAPETSAPFKFTPDNMAPKVYRLSSRCIEQGTWQRNPPNSSDSSQRRTKALQQEASVSKSFTPFDLLALPPELVDMIIKQYILGGGYKTYHLDSRSRYIIVDEVKDALYNTSTGLRKLYTAALCNLQVGTDLPMQVRILSPSQIQWADLANHLPVDDIRHVKITIDLEDLALPAKDPTAMMKIRWRDHNRSAPPDTAGLHSLVRELSSLETLQVDYVCAERLKKCLRSDLSIFDGIKSASRKRNAKLDGRSDEGSERFRTLREYRMSVQGVWTDHKYKSVNKDTGREKWLRTWKDDGVGGFHEVSADELEFGEIPRAFERVMSPLWPI